MILLKFSSLQYILLTINIKARVVFNEGSDSSHTYEMILCGVVSRINIPSPRKWSEFITGFIIMETESDLCRVECCAKVNDDELEKLILAMKDGEPSHIGESHHDSQSQMFGSDPLD